MKFKPEKTLIKLIREQGQKLPRMAAHCTLLSQIQHQLNQMLPELARQHCRLLNYRHGVLILAADSAEWATHIRYAGHDITQALQKNLGIAIREIKCEIDPYQENSQSS